MSETCAVNSAEPLDTRLPYSNAGSSGRTVNGYERRIVNPDSGEILPPGEIGELQLRGGALMSGFYKVDRRKVFTQDGYYTTGDLARVDHDGHLYFIARSSEEGRVGKDVVSTCRSLGVPHHLKTNTN